MPERHSMSVEVRDPSLRTSLQTARGSRPRRGDRKLYLVGGVPPKHTAAVGFEGSRPGGGGPAVPSSVQACWKALIHAVHQPGQGLLRRLKLDLVLENVVEIDVPSAKAIERGDWSTTVDHRDEILLV